MNPFLSLLLGGGASFLPSLLAHFFPQADPQQALRQKLMQLYSPSNMQNTTNQFYNQNLASPAFSQGQQAIAAGANATQGNVARALGNQGIGSGSSAILSSLSPSIVGGQMAGLRTGAYNQALGQAGQSIQNQGNALSMTGGPSMSQQFLGGGLDAFMPFLMRMLQSQRPGGGQTPVSYPFMFGG